MTLFKGIRSWLHQGCKEKYHSLLQDLENAHSDIHEAKAIYNHKVSKLEERISELNKKIAELKVPKQAKKQ